MNVIHHAAIVAAPYLQRYGYLAVFVAVALEGIGIPAPGVTLVVAAAFMAGQGAMSLQWVLLTGLFAALVGFNGGYLLGYYGGRELMNRLPFIRPRHMQRLSRLFDRWGTTVVVVAPFVDGLRQLNGFAAGTARMYWPRYAITNIIGSALWIGTWGGIAFLASTHATELYAVLEGGQPWWYVGGGVILVVAGLILWLRKRK